VVVPWAFGTTIIPMRWGLIPAWWTKAVKDVPPTFNVHARRVTEPFFWSAFKRNRCIIPASGYFEWKTMPDGKQPYYISAADGGVLSIAGVWDVWNNTENDDTVSSCCMIITSANAFIRAVHNRMPAFLDKKDFEPWLSGAAGTEVLKPAEEDYLRMWAVSKRVDQTEGGDDSELIAEIAAWAQFHAINLLNLNEKTESSGRFSIGKRTSSPHGPCAASNIKLDQPLQIKQEIEFGCRFEVGREDTSLETHP
jgi:putative SOS response-associated peptidase YedK